MRIQIPMGMVLDTVRCNIIRSARVDLPAVVGVVVTGALR